MYRTVVQLDAAMSTLAAQFPQLCTLVELPNRSIEGRPINVLRMRAGGGSNRPSVLIVGGMHARELMNPDAIVELGLDLVIGYMKKIDLVFGGASFSAYDVKVMLETLDIWFLPCANPDGRHEVMRPGGNRWWRKNKRAGNACSNGQHPGVDPNRNCDFVWGVVGQPTSCFPCSDSYVGKVPQTIVDPGGPFSEPESLNIKYLLDTLNINVFADVHSYSNYVLYPWGHAPTQTNDRSKQFTTLDALACQWLNPPAHQEYMGRRDYRRYLEVASNIRNTISAVNGSVYSTKPVYDIYPGTVSGSSSDYAYSRHIKNPALKKTYGFAFETGPFTGDILKSFQPDDPEAIKYDIKAGLLSLLKQAPWIDFLGEGLAWESVQTLHDIRDNHLAGSDAGREWINLFYRVQIELFELVESNRSHTKRAVRLLKRIFRLIDASGTGVINETDVKQGIAFLEKLKALTNSSRMRADLSDLVQQLKSSKNKDLNALIQALKESKPSSGRDL